MLRSQSLFVTNLTIMKPSEDNKKIQLSGSAGFSTAALPIELSSQRGLVVSLGNFSRFVCQTTNNLGVVELCR